MTRLVMCFAPDSPSDFVEPSFVPPHQPFWMRNPRTRARARDWCTRTQAWAVANGWAVHGTQVGCQSLTDPRDDEPQWTYLAQWDASTNGWLVLVDEPTTEEVSR